jgi:hypothetical protein
MGCDMLQLYAAFTGMASQEWLGKNTASKYNIEKIYVSIHRLRLWPKTNFVLFVEYEYIPGIIIS